MSKEYDFYKCKYDFQENGLPLPEDINAPAIDWLIKHGCEQAIPDLENIRKHGLFGQYKVANRSKANVIHVFKYQCGMIINWDVVTTIERENTISEVSSSYKNKFIKIKKGKRSNDGHIED